MLDFLLFLIFFFVSLNEYFKNDFYMQKKNYSDNTNYRTFHIVNCKNNGRINLIGMFLLIDNMDFIN